MLRRLCRGYMEMLVKYIIPAWQCNSLICLAPPAATPKPFYVRVIRSKGGWLYSVVALWFPGNGSLKLDRGSANTLPLPTSLSLCSLILSFSSSIYSFLSISWDNELPRNIEHWNWNSIHTCFQNILKNKRKRKKENKTWTNEIEL